MKKQSSFKTSHDPYLRMWEYAIALIMFIAVVAFTLLYLYVLHAFPFKRTCQMTVSLGGAVGTWCACVGLILCTGKFWVYRFIYWLTGLQIGKP
jgi:hypothetical protein